MPLQPDLGSPSRGGWIRGFVDYIAVIIYRGIILTFHTYYIYRVPSGLPKKCGISPPQKKNVGF